MDLKLRRLLLIVEFALIGWNISHTLSDLTICSEYLVSGPYGVEDSALTASSVWADSTHTCGPQNARLHFDGSTSNAASSWCAKNGNQQQYIQVRFSRKTEVNAVMLQGRGECCTEWVKTYYVMYSIDAITWTTVTSPSQQPRLFTGNTDENTVVRSSIVPSIPAVYLRINPRSWHYGIRLRFDVSGCYKVEETNSRSEFHRLPMITSPDFEEHVLFEKQSNVLPKCGQQCHKENTCSFDNNQRMCRGFTSAWSGLYAASYDGQAHFYVNKGKHISLGYRPILNETIMYRVNEINMNQTTATDVCKQQYSQLIKVDSESEMLGLQNIIAGNTILMHDHSQLFVSGMYVSLQWQYNDDEQINSALWSPGNPDPSQGHCVMLSQTGLTSVDCTETHFSICGLF